MTARMWIPGVPAAGHIATNGFWHPGSPDTCPKPPCVPTGGHRPNQPKEET